MKQAILSLSEHSLDKTAFIQLEPGDTLAEINERGGAVCPDTLDAVNYLSGLIQAT